VEGLTLTPGERRALLSIAREAIRARLAPGTRTGAPPTPPEEGWLAMPAAAFVTLRRGESLRGCIGHLERDRSLPDVVAYAAVSAALEDPRFPPVTAAELTLLSIEISVLGPMEPVCDPATIEVGRHGLVVHSGVRRGLLLPQVATEWGWDRETFLEQLCLKASLPRSAWRTADLFTFEALVFGDSEEPSASPDSSNP
jgi:AmmeMemoRadiSam system protein A